MNAAPARGLGKGLSALLNETYTQAPITPPGGTPAAAQNPQKGEGGSAGMPITGAPPLPPEIITQHINYSGPGTLATNSLKPSKYQPRQLFKEEHLKELADSILKNGIMQPILVRPVEGGHEIVAGERRWRASKLAGLELVPVIIREMTDQQALELAIVENVQRQDLTPLEEAGGYQRLMDEFGYTQEELATTLGKSRSHIGNLLRLLVLPDDVKAMLDDNKLTVGHARALLNASNPVALAQEIVKRGLNVRQAENLSRGNLMIGGDRPPRNNPIRKAAKDEDILSLEETLSTSLGLKVRINDRGQSGDIMITYNSLSELDQILRRLGGGL